MAVVTGTVMSRIKKKLQHSMRATAAASRKPKDVSKLFIKLFSGYAARAASFPT